VIPNRFVLVMSSTVGQKGQKGTNVGASPVKYAYYRMQTNALEDVSAFGSVAMNYTGGDKPEQLSCLQVSADTFKAFGTPILRGCSFSDSEDAPYGSRVALISEEIWTTRFASQPPSSTGTSR
jgi:hypothetical protein